MPDFLKHRDYAGDIATPWKHAQQQYSHTSPSQLPMLATNQSDGFKIHYVNYKDWLTSIKIQSFLQKTA